MGPWGSGCVCGSDWEGCTGRGEARGSRELCACAGHRMLMLMLMLPVLPVLCLYMYI